MRAKLVNASGQMKEVKVGYSWTTFFFGYLIPLFRGDMRNFWIAFGISCVCDAANVIIPGIPVIIHVIYNIAYLAPQYNKLYTKFLVRKGYRAASDADVQALRSNGYPVGQFAAAETNEE